MSNRPACWCPQEPKAWPGSSNEAIKGWRDIPDNHDLRHAVIDDPDDDAPRREYADWMSKQSNKVSRQIGAFIHAQLRVADARRRVRHADVSALRSWTSDGRLIRPEQYVSPGMFRAGGVLRPWVANSLGGVRGIAWPQAFRGFVERVWMRARTFVDHAPLLFRAAPIRSLVLVEVPEIVGQLAACADLRRIRSLSLPRYETNDCLDDEHLSRLLASPHLCNLRHLRLVHHRKLTRSSYANVVNMLPLLSSFEVFLPRPEWEFCTSFDAWSRCERVVTIDSVISAVRSQDWIDMLEQEMGPMPCLRPDVYYGPEPDIEAFIVNPIAPFPRTAVHQGQGAQGHALESNG